jgi:hypothetical protein
MLEQLSPFALHLCVLLFLLPLLVIWLVPALHYTADPKAGCNTFSIIKTVYNGIFSLSDRFCV